MQLLSTEAIGRKTGIEQLTGGADEGNFEPDLILPWHLTH
jgi:hypothetical protein